jgi:energy-coupling factor transporter transmembrane protein EcfT
MKYVPLDDELPHQNDRRYPIAMVVVIVLGILLIVWNTTVGLTVGFVFLLPIVFAIHLGVSRDRTGWMWGLFLSWLGVLILACMRPQPPKEL